jgi:hypothetical protein
VRVIAEPLGATASQTAPDASVPWPLSSPAALSPANV